MMEVMPSQYFVSTEDSTNCTDQVNRKLGINVEVNLQRVVNNEKLYSSCLYNTLDHKVRNDTVLYKV